MNSPVCHSVIISIFVAISSLLSAADKPDHSFVPGSVIDHIAASSRSYIGSPSITILDDGSYLASHDFFGPGSSSRSKGLTLIFTSSDKGATWQKVSEIKGMFWGKLFVHQKEVYILGTEKEYGNIIIRKSTDKGKSWTEPKDSKTGILKRGTYHCAPMQVVIHKDRIWRSFEYNCQANGPWGKNFQAGVISAPADCDLLDSDNWQFSNFIARDPGWLDGKFNAWLEGNIVVNPSGKLVNILRVDTPAGNKAAVVNINEDGRKVSFDPSKGFVDMPGGAKKFFIRYDSKSKLYFALVNNIDSTKYENREAASIRNTLSLAKSSDLKNWKVISTLLHHDEVSRHGFQYPDWQFDGDDIIYVSRTAYYDGLGGAHNHHDANYMTFHRIKNFRQYSLARFQLDELAPGTTVSLFDGKSMGLWKSAEFISSGKIYVSDGSIVLEKGNDMTGITWSGPIAKKNYEISLQGRRLEGYDFFCGLTFPVGNSYCFLYLRRLGRRIVRFVKPGLLRCGK